MGYLIIGSCLVPFLLLIISFEFEIHMLVGFVVVDCEIRFLFIVTNIMVVIGFGYCYIMNYHRLY